MTEIMNDIKKTMVEESNKSNEVDKKIIEILNKQTMLQQRSVTLQEDLISFI